MTVHADEVHGNTVPFRGNDGGVVYHLSYTFD
jgi:hypothetical protein